jgi:hypothetical protein
MDGKARQGISVTVEFNQTLDKGYRVVQWKDRALMEIPTAESSH